jgi:hypothetical protein
MYVVAVEGEPEKTLDLSGVYRVVALINPLDGHPMSLDAQAVVAQMTCPKDQCLIAPTTRDAMHALVWGAAAGAVTRHTFAAGPAIALTALSGTEYEHPAKQYGEIRAPAGPAAARLRR